MNQLTQNQNAISTNNFFFIISTNGQLLICNTAWLSLLNISATAIKQYNLLNMLDLKSRQWLRSLDLKNYQGGTPFQDNTVTITASKTVMLEGLLKVASLVHCDGNEVILCHFVREN